MPAEGGWREYAVASDLNVPTDRTLNSGGGGMKRNDCVLPGVLASPCVVALVAEPNPPPSESCGTPGDLLRWWLS